MADVTEQAMRWARENPITAKATGVDVALAATRRWKQARDKLLLEQAADEKVTHALFCQLKRLLEHVRALDVLKPSLEAVINDADTAVRQAEAAGWRDVAPARRPAAKGRKGGTR